MTSVLAHQGGWDELLLPALIVALVLAVPAVRRRRRAEGDEPVQEEQSPGPEKEACSYCGDPVAQAGERCPSCGFRVRR